MFKLPRVVGQYQGKEITAAIGRFGPYLRFDGKFVSIPKTDDPVSITVERAVELINNKAEAEKQKVIRTFAEEPAWQVINGRYGPYISFDNKNYKIEKGTDASLLTLEDCRRIIAEEKPSMRSARRAAAIAKRGAAKTATAKTAKSSTAPKSPAGKSKSTGKK